MKPRRRTPSFRLKVTLIAALLAAVPLVVVGLVADRVNKRGLADANGELLALATKTVGDELRVWENDTTVRIVTAAQTLADPNTPGDRAQLVWTQLAPLGGTCGIFDANNQLVEQNPRESRISLAKLAPHVAVDTVEFTRADSPGVVVTTAVRGAAATWSIACVLPVPKRVVDTVRDLGAGSLAGYTVLLVDSGQRILADATGEREGQLITRDMVGIYGDLQGHALEHSFALRGEYHRGDDTRVVGMVATLAPPFALITEAPEAEVYESLTSVRRLVLVATLVAIAIALVAGILLARQVTKPIKRLVDYAGDLAQRRFASRVTVHTRDELGVLGLAMQGAADSLAESEAQIRKEQAIRTDLGRYLPEKLVDQIVARERDVTLGGQRREVTVMFADVVGFTPLAERQPAETVVTMLNELFTILTEIVFRHGGTVDKFIGDCVMAIWGAPDDQPDHASRALAAARDMQAWLDAGNESWSARFGFTVELAIGVNTGEAVVGNFGSETRMEYTAIGDAVNVAARLESIARPNQILASKATASRAPHVKTRSLGVRALAGKAEPVELFEVLP
ncbi:MAG TPA: adenylate/guanylate cyclase domain-containing protein [Kofleriaceae bacterium]|jgi:class 3 adenylate cyclase